MLLRIREVTAGKLSYFIIAVISVPFALWGINYYFQGGDGPVVIEIGATEITLGEYNVFFNQRKRELEASMGSSSMPPDEAIRGDVIRTLVRGELLRQTAEKYRYHVSDVEVAEAIMAMPEFMYEGQFDQEQYVNLLSANRQSPVVFEKDVKDQLLRNQLYRTVEQSSFVLPSEQSRYNQLLSQERHIRYVEFPVAEFVGQDTVSATEITTYYEDNKQDFMHSDVFYLQYVEVKKDDIIAGLVIEEDELRAYYDDNLDLFTAPERRTVAHILIDPERHPNAQERAQEVYEQLKRGADFAALAKAESDDSLTADQGGKLLPLTREDLDDAAQEAVFTLMPNEFSAPVLSDFGWQIFELLAVESSNVRTFEEVRDTIYKEIADERAESLYVDAAQEMDRRAYQHHDNLFPVVQEMELIEEVKAANRLNVEDREGILQYPAVLAAAYTDEVKNQLNSRVIEVAPGHAMVIKGSGGVGGAYRPGRQKTLGEVNQEIRDILLYEKARLRARSAVEEAIRNLRDNNKQTALDELAQQRSLRLHDVGFIRRDGLADFPDITQNAFLMRPTTLSRTAIQMRSADSYAIIELIGVRQANISEVADDEQWVPLSFLLDEYNAILLGIFGENAVTIHEDRFGDET